MAAGDEMYFLFLGENVQCEKQVSGKAANPLGQHNVCVCVGVKLKINQSVPNLSAVIAVAVSFVFSSSCFSGAK